MGFPGNNFIGGFGTDEGVGSIWVTLKDWSERYAQEGQDLSSVMANLRGIAASVPEARVMVSCLSQGITRLQATSQPSRMASPTRR